MKLSKHEQCDQSRLELLLRSDEESREFAAARKHVERCSACQQRLTELAADEPSWQRMRGALAEDDEVLALQDTTPWKHEPWKHEMIHSLDASAGVERVVRDCLAPPSHPEMLGRLGRYEIERVIGSGGMGVVFKGHDTELNRPVAVKVLAPHLADNATARRWFAREGRAAAAVMHEHVVAVHNVETDGPFPYLVMQFVPGHSLQARVQQQGPLEVKEVLRISMQIASGLAAAHAQGLVHRDIKPSNILLEDNVERTLLTDFGLARIAEDVSMTRTGIVAGTPHYMSPEQAQGEPVDARSDLFSLGSVMYFMCTGRPPFRADRALAVLSRICRDPHQAAWQIDPEIPDEVSDLIDRLLEKNARRRYGSAAEVERVLSGLLTGRPSLIAHGRRRQTLRRWIRTQRKPVRRAAWTLATAATVGFVAWLAAVDFHDGWFTGNDTPLEAESDRPGVATAISPGIADRNSANLADFSALSPTALDGKFSGVQRQLQQIEEEPPRQFWQSGQDDWLEEASGIERELSQLERSMKVSSNPSGEQQ